MSPLSDLRPLSGAGLYAYIDALERPAGFKPTGFSKDIYLDLMEWSIQEYGLEQADQSWGTDPQGCPEDLQTYCRVVSVLAGLMAGGRKLELFPLWERMMETGCRELPRTTGNQMADFSTKELLLAYKAMKPHVSAEQSVKWKNELARIEPAVNYVYTLASVSGPERLHNINIYNMAGEYLRETEGMASAAGYLAEHWPVQLRKFDGNGMYMDPGCPLLYDLAARCHIQLMLAAGYRGAFHEDLNDKLAAGGMMTLFMQSAAGQFPYGGRSSQFQFNEALAAACAEFEAARYRRQGRLKLAGAFKRSARLSVQAILRFVRDIKPPRHVKNYYGIRSGYGTESYAYYDKYMITLGSFAYMAYLFAEDDIAEEPCPAESGGYVLATSEHFHQVFASAGGQSVQLDTAADHRYDSTGLGRYHRQGVPAELALSSPLCAAPEYRLPGGGRSLNAAIGPGWERQDGTAVYLADLSGGLEHELHVLRQDSGRVEFRITYHGQGLPEDGQVTERYVLTDDGLEIVTELAMQESGPILYRVPLFCGNGQEWSAITAEPHAVNVALGPFRYTVGATGCFFGIEEAHYGNRNGEYRLAVIRSPGPTLSLRLKLWTEGEPGTERGA
ncbi:hypothetical protein [Paenibacillus silagei]|uniref:Uncharacterized protein n=1 Tax=Paenibacillus silagei TaxID=1670801 RepID=A0ABS4NRY2_9BACL|nr:hypothetical protein [Paenibacillus silagei]MBP2112805.1 hypothetical protein [Paenibacillus silagei]